MKKRRKGPCMMAWGITWEERLAVFFAFPPLFIAIIITTVIVLLHNNFQISDIINSMRKFSSLCYTQKKVSGEGDEDSFAFCLWHHDFVLSLLSILNMQSCVVSRCNYWRPSYTVLWYIAVFGVYCSLFWWASVSMMQTLRIVVQCKL